MRVCSARSARPLAALLLLAPAGGRAQGAPAVRTESAAAPYIGSGLQLYESLEFPAALDRFRRAEKCAGLSSADAVLIHTYEGMIEGNLSSPDAAAPDFRAALTLDPHAELPGGTSPKLRAVWEQVRREVVLRADVPPVAASPASVAATPAAPLAPSDEPIVAATQERGFALRSPTPVEVGIAGGGALVSIVGVVLGVVANRTGSLAGGDHFQDNASSDLHTALQQQTAAVVLIAAGAAGVIAGGALYLGTTALGSAPSASAP